MRSTLTIDRKYMGKQYGVLNKFNSICSLIFALLASPLVVLRRDGCRELLFVLVARWAKVLGPYAQAGK